MTDARIKTAKGPTILLQSGTYFDLLDPFTSDFTIQDIAHGLSLTCRFAGQCREFYSVAEHSWHASQLVADEFKLAALMHDAAEAFLGDVTRPLKSLLPEYQRIERNVEAAVADRFGINGMDSDAVKRADLAMLAAEQEAMMPPHADARSQRR
jgi:5'-deoxynucleotidase YfbR-like HD superfamily hydrolase